MGKASQPIASAESVREFSMTSLHGNAEFGLHVLKRRTSGKQEDRYTIGVWEDDVLPLSVTMHVWTQRSLRFVARWNETPATLLFCHPTHGKCLERIFQSRSRVPV
jgi:hypothetical protein